MQAMPKRKDLMKSKKAKKGFPINPAAVANAPLTNNRPAGFGPRATQAPAPVKSGLDQAVADAVKKVPGYTAPSLPVKTAGFNSTYETPQEKADLEMLRANMSPRAPVDNGLFVPSAQTKEAFKTGGIPAVVSDHFAQTKDRFKEDVGSIVQPIKKVFGGEGAAAVAARKADALQTADSEALSARRADRAELNDQRISGTVPLPKAPLPGFAATPTNGAETNDQPAAPAAVSPSARPAGFAPGPAAAKITGMMDLNEQESRQVQQDLTTKALKDGMVRKPGLSFTEKLQGTDPEGTKAAQARYDSGAKLTRRDAQLLGLRKTSDGDDYGTVQVADTSRKGGQMQTRAKSEDEWLSELNQHNRDSAAADDAAMVAAAGIPQAQQETLKPEGKLKALESLFQSSGTEVERLTQELADAGLMLNEADRKQRPILQQQMEAMQQDLESKKQLQETYRKQLEGVSGSATSGNVTLDSQPEFAARFRAEYGRDPSNSELQKAKGRHWG